MTVVKRNLFFTYLLVCVTCAAQPDSRIRSILGDLGSVRGFKEVAISPDGKRIAWVEELRENGNDTGNSAIYVVERRPGGLPVRVTASGGKAAFSEPDRADRG